MIFSTVTSPISITNFVFEPGVLSENCLSSDAAAAAMDRDTLADFQIAKAATATTTESQSRKF